MILGDGVTPCYDPHGTGPHTPRRYAAVHYHPTARPRMEPSTMTTDKPTVTVRSLPPIPPVANITTPRIDVIHAEIPAPDRDNIAHRRRRPILSFILTRLAWAVFVAVFLLFGFAIWAPLLHLDGARLIFTAVLALFFAGILGIMANVAKGAGR